jgi:predicted component of type VI protein secretion system
MAYPLSHSQASAAPGSLPSGTPSRCSQQNRLPSDLQAEGDHQLEKLEFALAVALTRGDNTRTAQLRDQIAALGGNHEEPGT